jgi:hypothetical protein
MPQDFGSKRLKVRPDVFFVRSEEGTWLRNSAGSFFLKGARSYEILRSLLLEFDGTQTVNDACGNLQLEQRAALETKLLYPLVRRGFLFEVPQPTSVHAWIEARYCEHIAFLENYIDRPVERLLEVRSRHVVCAGSGILLRAAAVALADLGFASVHVVSADRGPDAALLSDIVAAAAEEGEGNRWTFAARQAASLGDLISATAEDFADGVILASGSSDFREIAETVQTAGCRVRAVGVITVAGGFVLASPLLTGESWCWECLHRSILSESAAMPAPPSASLAAFQLIQRLFCHFAGPPVPEDMHLTSVDCRTLNVRTHAPRRHAACPRHPLTQTRVWIPEGHFDDGIVRPDIPTSRDADELTAAQNLIIQTIAGWTDRVTGPFLSVDEDDLPQYPLSASRCRVRAPSSLPEAVETMTFECRAISPREARNQVVLQGLEWLAETTAKMIQEHVQYVAYGAGWSLAEAVYRALASLALRHLVDRMTAGPRAHKAAILPESSLLKFLLNTLSDAGRSDIEIWIDETEVGLSEARVVFHGDHLGVGVGADDAHAISNALADAVARCTVPGCEATARTACLAPSTRRWPELLSEIRARAHQHYQMVDAVHLLPFLGKCARIVALMAPALQEAAVSG